MVLLDTQEATSAALLAVLMLSQDATSKALINLMESMAVGRVCKMDGVYQVPIEPILTGTFLLYMIRFLQLFLEVVEIFRCYWKRTMHTT